MLNLKKRYYPLSWLLGLIHFITLTYPQFNNYCYTAHIVVLLLKSKKEGFRLNIFFYGIGVFLELIQCWLLSWIALLIYIYLTHKLINYYLPDDGLPVGHQYHKDPFELAIYYPGCPIDCKTRKLGAKWLKVKDYARRMDDTAKKDVRRKRRVPYLFFKVVVSQFYKFFMNVYENAKIDLSFGDKSQDKKKFSIIVLSHGLASHCDGYSVVARYLAQQGYIVFVPEHLENIRNIYLTNEENREYRREQLKERIETIKKVLDIIYDQKRFSKLFQGSPVVPDYNEISIIGHSFGGSTAYALAQTEPRITGACILYDPVPQSIMQVMYLFDFEDKVKLHIPLMSINADDFYKRLYPFMENDERLAKAFELIDGPISDHCLNIYIRDQQHADFSDIPIIWNGESALYSISKNVHQVHLRFGMILLLTKVFLQQAKNYHQIKDQKNTCQGNQDLKEIVLREVYYHFDEESRKLLRWAP